MSTAEPVTRASEVIGDSFVLGGNVFGWTADEEESFAVLDAFVKAGGLMVDTADVYMASVPGLRGGESEEIIGRWLAARGTRNEVTLATKVGMHPEFKGLRPDTIRSALEASLRRLGVDRIDVYYAHLDDPETPLAESLAALDELVREGKVGRLGASNYSPARLREALELSARHGWARFEFVQAHYNLVRRETFEAELRPVLIDHDVVALPYYSLAQGFLTGKYRTPGSGDSVRSRAAERYLADARGPRVLGVLDRLSAKHRAAPAAIALAWLREQPTVGAPLASARTLAQLPDLVASREVVLDADDLTDLDAASR